MTGHILNLSRSSLLHKTPVYSHSPQVSPGQHSVVALTFHSREDLSGPPSTSGYLRDVTCPATLLRVQPYVSHVSFATPSVTSPSRLKFPRGLLTDLRRPGSQFSLPAFWLYSARLLLTQTSPVSSDRFHAAVWVVSSCLVRSAARHYMLTASTQVRMVCIRGNSALCAVKGLHSTTNLGLKINNFVTYG